MDQNDYEQVWKSITDQVKSYEGVDSSQVDAFFSRLTLQAASEGFAMLTAGTGFIKEWVQTHYMKEIRQAFEDVYGTPFDVEIEAYAEPQAPSPARHKTSSRGAAAEKPSQKRAQPMDKSDSPTRPVLKGKKTTKRTSAASSSPTAEAPSLATSEKPEIAAKQEQPDRQPDSEPTSKAGAVSECTFDNFVIGESNKDAYSMALYVAENPGNARMNPLFIYGKSGVGKTHLLTAIKNYIEGAFPHMRVVYVDTMTLVDSYTDAATSRNKSSFLDFRRAYESADVLLVDDVQGLQHKTETLNMVFQIFNKMIPRGKQIVLAADRAPKNIDIDERYQSRFNQGGTSQVQPPELETKLGIIKQFVKECSKADGVDYQLPANVQEYIARNSSSNIRELKSAITNVIMAMSTRHKTTMTLDEVRELLKNHFSGGPKERLHVKDVQEAVARYYNVSVSDLTGKGRMRNVVRARQVAMYFCRSLIEIPENDIGKAFGRDHSTVHYSVEKVLTQQKDNRDLREELEVLRQIILEEQ